MKCEVVFTFGNCFIQDLFTRKKIGSAEVYDGLYILNNVNNSVNDNGIDVVFSANYNKDELWHFRLGHIP